jgi:hypothetical protein
MPANRTPEAVIHIDGTNATGPRTQHTLPDLTRCGGSSLTSYIGRPVTDMRILNLENSHFVCQEDCVATADVRATRLTVFYSKKTGRVTNMYCE